MSLFEFMRFWVEREPVDIDDINEMVVRTDSLSCVLSCLLSAIKETHPDTYEKAIEYMQLAAHSFRTQLGDVNEEDISQYAHAVADGIEDFLPDENVGETLQ